MINMGKLLLNGKQICEELNISAPLLYKLRRSGMPYHQLPHGRAYYILDEVTSWLLKAGYHQEKTWSK